MALMEPTPIVTNADVARRLGLSQSGASRLRSGDRNPSIDLIVRVEKEYGWPIAEQVIARHQGKYAAELEKVLLAEAGTTPESP